MPLKISDILTLPPILNKWADKVDAKLAELDKFRVKHDKSIKTLTTATSVVLPQNPTGVSITESGFMVDNMLKSQVSVTYTPPNPQGTFAGVFLVVTGYHGQAAPVKVGEDTYTGSGASQTFNVTLDRTGETVTFYVVPKTQNEQTGLWTNGVVVSNVTLDGALGSQIRIGHVGAGGGNLCPNSGFEFNQGGYNAGSLTYQIPAGTYISDNWYCFQNAGYFGALIDTGTFHSGARALGLTYLNGVTVAPGTNYIIMVSDAIQAKPGDLVYLKGYLRTDQSVAFPANVSATTGIQLRMVNGAGAENGLFASTATAAANGAFTLTTPGPFLVPAGSTVGFKVSCYLGIVNNTGGNITMNNGWFSSRFDDLTVHVQQASSSIGTAATNAYTPNSQPLSNTGTNSTISVASSTVTYPWGNVGYNSGSVNPGVFGTFYVYCDDGTFQGGAVTYVATTSNPTITANDARVYFGKITTVSGGGGSTGGGGGGGACLSPNTRVKTRWLGIPYSKAISKFKKGDWVKTLAGWRRVAEVLRHDFEDIMLDMGQGELITEDHAVLHADKWTPAIRTGRWNTSFRYYKGDVWNLMVATDNDEERNYELRNGIIAHNVQK